MNKKYFLVLDQQLAGCLMIMRHRLITARPDKTDNTKTVFFFKNNDQFQKDFYLLKDKKYLIENFINDLKD